MMMKYEEMFQKNLIRQIGRLFYPAHRQKPFNNNVLVLKGP